MRIAGTQTSIQAIPATALTVFRLIAEELDDVGPFVAYRDNGYGFANGASPSGDRHGVCGPLDWTWRIESVEWSYVLDLRSSELLWLVVGEDI